METRKTQNLLRGLIEDSTSGATEFVDKALEIIRIQLERTTDQYKDIKEEIIYLSKQIINTRPSMAPLINTLGYFIHGLEKINKKTLVKRLNKFNLDRQKRNESLELAFQTFLKRNKKFPLKIMVISYSSTIINLLLKNKEFNIEIFVLESRPLLEGRKTAEILSEYFKTHLIVDAGMGKFMDQIDLILIGADSILKDGSIINKVGTYPLAVIANAENVDVYAVADSYKYNLRSLFNQPIMIETKATTEIYNKEIKYELLEVHNYYFDITSSKYITGIISNYGILSIQEFLEKVQQDLPTKWFKYLLDNKKI